MMHISHQSCEISSGSSGDLPHLVSLRKISPKTLEDMPYLGILEVLEEILGSFAASYKKFFFGRFGRNLHEYLFNLRKLRTGT